MKRALIFSGGSFDYDFSKEFILKNKFDLIIAADRGVEYAILLDLKVDYLIGDFDSVDEKILKKAKLISNKVVEFEKEKDDTDTALAIDLAIRENVDEIVLLSATGNRLDHTMTTIFSLISYLDTNINIVILDKNNKIYLKKDETFFIEKKEQHGKYVSFLPFTKTVKLSLKGMKYNLDNFVVNRGSTLLQSNEIEEERAKIIIEDGILAVFETLD